MAEITDRQLRQIARAFLIAVNKGEKPSPDAFFNARLRTLGCPDVELRAYRARIGQMPFNNVPDEEPANISKLAGRIRDAYKRGEDAHACNEDLFITTKPPSSAACDRC
jgi:hypothetical protein